MFSVNMILVILEVISEVEKYVDKLCTLGLVIFIKKCQFAILSLRYYFIDFVNVKLFAFVFF